MNFREKARELHESVNHTYDGHNYVLHLDAAIAVGKEFELDLFEYHRSLKNLMSIEEYDIFISNSLWNAIYFHDVEEDCRMTYNNIKDLIGTTAADIVHAVTNHKGKTRDERANDLYYQEIRETPGASFVKMCDRIANARYSQLMGSTMYDKYKKENENFMTKVDADRFPRMKECLINIFK